MQNSADNYSFSDLFSVYLKVIDPLIWNFSCFGGIQQVLNSDFLVQDFGNFDLSPMT